MLMAIKREKEDGRACRWCWLGESAVVLERKITTRWGAAPWVEGLGLGFPPFFVFFFSKLPPLQVLETSI